MDFRCFCVSLQCPQLTCSNPCAPAGTESLISLRVCTDADVMELAHITVLDRPVLTFVHTHKQTVLHADTHGAWQPGGGGRMQGLAVPLCVCETEMFGVSC